MQTSTELTNSVKTVTGVEVDEISKLIKITSNKQLKKGQLTNVDKSIDVKERQPIISEFQIPPIKRKSTKVIVFNDTIFEVKKFINQTECSICKSQITSGDEHAQSFEHIVRERYREDR